MLDVPRNGPLRSSVPQEYWKGRTTAPKKKKRRLQHARLARRDTGQCKQSGKNGVGEVGVQAERLCNRYHCSKNSVCMANGKPFRPCAKIDCPVIHGTKGTVLEGVEVTKDHVDYMRKKFDDRIKRQDDRENAKKERQQGPSALAAGQPNQGVSAYDVAGPIVQGMSPYDQQAAMLN